MKLLSRRVIVATVVLCASASLAFAFTLSTRQDTVGQDTFYRYRVTVATGDLPLRDLHIVSTEAKVKLSGQMMTPVIINADGSQGTALNGWTTNPQSDGSIPKTAKDVGWRTADEQPGGEGDNTPGDEPVPVGATVEFTIRAPSGRFKTGNVHVHPTTNGTTVPPPGAPPPGFGDKPAPVLTATMVPSDETPGPNTAVLCALESCVPGENWQVYLAKTLSTGPGSDPLGIGINTNDPIPPAWGIALAPSSGTMSSPPLGTFPSASTTLTVGSAPIGSEFYAVFVCKEAGDPNTWTDPIHFVVTLP